MRNIASFLQFALICLLYQSVVGLPKTHDEQIGHVAKGSQRSRSGRCFQTMWNWLVGRAKEEYEENIISVDPSNVRFFLYNDPNDPSNYQEIVYQDINSLMRAPYRYGQTWKFLIHGYTMSQFGTFPVNVKNAYLEEYRRQLMRDAWASWHNVVVVDWGPLADPKITGDSSLKFAFLYSFAVNNVKITGQRVGEFIQFLRESGALESYDKVHIIGFSLGAHASGNAGRTILKNTGEKVSRITGLDPAGPSFYAELTSMSSPKLKKDDAKFVDVYHSNQGAFGTLSNLGDVDFYPNGGGPIQQYCVDLEHQKGENRSLVELGSCSHNRAPFYFAMSISTAREPMIACPCSSYNEYKKGCDCSQYATFGEYCDPTTTGVYYITIPDN